jgi:transketolase
MAAKLDGRGYRVYAMTGCGESQEGQVWEAAMAAAHYHLDNLIVLQDYNGRQIDGSNEEVMCVTPLVEKWSAFGWRVLEIDGHDMLGILEALDQAQQAQGRPTVIVAHTLKGKGVSFMVDRSEWHSGPPSDAQYRQAMEELGCEEVSHG